MDIHAYELNLWLCPTFGDNHKGLEEEEIYLKSNPLQKYIVVRVVWTLNGVQHQLLDPGYGLTLILLRECGKEVSGFKFLRRYVQCCHCWGFNDAVIYRKKFTQKPYRYE